MRPSADPRLGLAGVVLAAGAASRFGSPKQAAVIGGIPLVARATRAVLACCPAGVVVVTGSHVAEVRACLEGLAVTQAHNADWASGIASSIRAGVAALPLDASACLVSLCDQPDVDATDLARLVDAWAAAPRATAAAHYAGITGVPAIFPRSAWSRLLELSGDAGARSLLASLADVTRVRMPHAARDVDTPADLI